MLEKEAEELFKKKPLGYEMKPELEIYTDGFKDGYNKANEWHYVKDEGTPTKEGHYLVCLRNKYHDIFDCWILFDKDIGWYSLQVRLVDVYAWKEIVLSELTKEIE